MFDFKKYVTPDGVYLNPVADFSTDIPSLRDYFVIDNYQNRVAVVYW